jgi:hypothetical protein
VTCTPRIDNIFGRQWRACSLPIHLSDEGTRRERWRGEVRGGRGGEGGRDLERSIWERFFNKFFIDKE